MRALVALAAVMVAALCASAAADPPKTVGAATCASGACHAAVEPAIYASVQQNEYSVWKSSDPHSKAWRVLQSDRAVRMAQRAGAGTPTQDPTCLSCHATAAPGVAAGPQLTREEGVSCESCHGAAEQWIGPHSRGLYHYDELLSTGLKPIVTVQERAPRCLGCHAPGAGVTHRLIAAGHPRTDFDLASYSRLQPSHYVIDADYLQRKRPPTEATLWAVGAADMIGARFRALADPRRGADGLFPELALLSCNACHVAISDFPMAHEAGIAWHEREVFDLSEETALKAVGEIVAPAQTAVFEQRLTAVRAALGDRATFAPAAAGFADAADSLGAAIASAGVAAPAAAAALTKLLDPSDAPRGRDSVNAAHAVRALARTALAGRALSAADAGRLSQRLGDRVGRGPGALVADDADLAAAVQAAVRATEKRQ